MLITKEVELKYDDGETVRFCSQGAGWGYSVRFSPPITPFTISEVKVMAGLFGTEYADQKASLEIWNQDRDLLYSCEVLATEVSQEKGWITVETGNITVGDDFRVVFFTNWDGEAGGISIGYDLSGNKASEVVKTGGLLTEWPPVWETGSHPRPKDKTNWMIRAVGIPAKEGTPIHSPPSKTEFQKTINSLYNPSKVSRWMFNNIGRESHYEQYKKTGVHHIARPEELFETKVGCCADYAVYACYVLQYHDYRAEILSIEVESDPSRGHAVCVTYNSYDSLFVFDWSGIKGPYEAYEDFAFDYHKDWSEYRIYLSWEKFQRHGTPDKVIHRNKS